MLSAVLCVVSCVRKVLGPSELWMCLPSFCGDSKDVSGVGAQLRGRGGEGAYISGGYTCHGSAAAGITHDGVQGVRWTKLPIRTGSNQTLSLTLWPRP